MKDYFSSIESSECNLVEQNDAEYPLPLSTSLSSELGIEMMAAECVSDLVKATMQCVTAYKMCQEQEITKRRAISANLNVLLTQIQAKKEENHEIIVESFKKYGDELQSLNEIAQDAAQKGDHETLRIVGNLILAIYDRMPTIQQNNLDFMCPKSF